MVYKLFIPLLVEFVPQTAALTTDSSATDIRIAFLLTLNGRAVRQVHRLLKTLYSPKHFYFIHIDSVCTKMYCSELISLNRNSKIYSVRITFTANCSNSNRMRPTYDWHALDSPRSGVAHLFSPCF